MPQDPQQVVVVGGGVVGCCVAYRLALEGVAVTVVERSAAGAGASGQAAGNLQPVPCGSEPWAQSLAVQSLGLYRAWLPAIKEQSGIEPFDRDVAFLYVALDEEDVVSTSSLAESLRRAGLRGAWLDAAEVRELEPRLAPRALGGMLHQDCLQMDAPRFMEALARAAQRSGVRFHIGTATGVARVGNQVKELLLNDGTTLPCATLVLALGAWTASAVSAWLGMSLPVQPLTLQKLHLRAVYPSLRCGLRWRGTNIVTRSDGLIHLGSKPDLAGFEACPTTAGREWLIQRFHTLLPETHAEVVEASAGVAAWLADGMPLLGPLPGYAGINVAVSSANGFLLAPVLADILANFLVHGTPHPLLGGLPGLATPAAAGLP